MSMNRRKYQKTIVIKFELEPLIEDELQLSRHTYKKSFISLFLLFSPDLTTQ